MPDEFKGGLTVSVQRTDSSPYAYDPVEKPFSMSGFGESAGTIKTTNFESSQHEYINDLVDGNEFSLNCNRVHVSPSCQDYLQGKVGQEITLRVVQVKTDESPYKYRRWDMAVRFNGYEIDPQVEDKNMITFNFKVTGTVTRTQTAGS